VICKENFLTNHLVNEFWKSVHICQNYYQTSNSLLFWNTVETKLSICLLTTVKILRTNRLCSTFLIHQRRILFWLKMVRSNNVILHTLAGCSRDSVVALLDKYSPINSHCEPSMLSSCVVKRWFWLYFSNLCQAVWPSIRSIHSFIVCPLYVFIVCLFVLLLLLFFILFLFLLYIFLFIVLCVFLYFIITAALCVLINGWIYFGSTVGPGPDRAVTYADSYCLFMKSGLTVWTLSNNISVILDL